MISTPTHPGMRKGFRGHLRRLGGLRPRMLILILAVYVATGVLLLVGFEAILTRITERLGTVVARMQVLANKSLIREPLTREIALARQLAASPLLRSWALDEDNPGLRGQALAELESFRRQLSSGTWFYAIDRTLHYYFNWVSLEEYIRTATAVQFSHGICSDCIRSVYPEDADRILEKMRDAKTEPHADTRPIGGDERTD
jgi:hypothetical protein